MQYSKSGEEILKGISFPYQTFEKKYLFSKGQEYIDDFSSAYSLPGF